MKYVHGTDNRRRDLLMVWFYRLGAMIVLLVLLFCLWFCISVASWAFTGDAYGILFLIGIILCLAYSLFELYECVWRNARYKLDETGITIVYLFHSKHYPWNVFQRVFISKIKRIPYAKPEDSYDYIILMKSECAALADIFALQYCWRYESKFIIVRKTEERINEFSKYCTFSDPPKIKAYKYPF